MAGKKAAPKARKRKKSGKVRKRIGGMVRKEGPKRNKLLPAVRLSDI